MEVIDVIEISELIEGINSKKKEVSERMIEEDKDLAEGLETIEIIGDQEESIEIKTESQELAKEAELEETKKVEAEYPELQEKYLHKMQVQHKPLNKKEEH